MKGDAYKHDIELGIKHQHGSLALIIKDFRIAAYSDWRMLNAVSREQLYQKH